MTIKSATPNGSQRERAPGGWARVWPDNAAALLAVLTKPWPAEAMTLDLDLWVDRVNHGGEPMPGRRCLAARWGVGERTARTVIDRWRESSPVALYASGGPAPRPAEGPAEGPAARPASAATMPMDSGSDAEKRPAEGPAPRPAEGPAAVPGLFEKLQPVAIVAAPQTADIQTADKNTIMPAKAGGVDLQALLDEMHAMELAVKPKAVRPRLSSYEKSMRKTIEGLKQRAREDGTTPVQLMMAAWRWWWTCAEGWHRTTLPGSKGYKAFFQAPHVIGYLDRMRDEAAAAAPVAPAEAPAKPKSPGEVAWDRWMEGLDAARAWYSAHKGTREGDAFHAAMEAACKPSPIAELFGGYMDNPKEKRVVRETFIIEYERRTTPLRLVAR